MRTSTCTVSALILATACIPALTGCQEPVSTKGLDQQRAAIAADGQLAMRQQDGTVGNPSDAELQQNVNMVQDPFDPDPFIAQRSQEISSRQDEGTEVPDAMGEGIGTNPMEVDPSGDIGQP
ncbi:MAG: hypothetical protein CMJ40_10385 [Phycisphaerae bacterium]|nr:hypothetical protein [Phycisphaerae bacterium]|tara:strand:+ start:1201 stop:1566 length:366 start_codon:yes stop_codon:yes gene_type:complete